MTITIVVEVGPHSLGPTSPDAVYPYDEFIVGIVMAIPLRRPVKPDVYVIGGPNQFVGQPRATTRTEDGPCCFEGGDTSPDFTQHTARAEIEEGFVEMVRFVSGWENAFKSADGMGATIDGLSEHLKLVAQQHGFLDLHTAFHIASKKSLHLIDPY